MTEPTEVYEECAAELTRMVERPFRVLEPLAAAFAAVHGAGTPQAADLGAVDTVTDAVLAADDELFGAGVVVQPGTLMDRELFLQWRQRRPDGEVGPLLLDVDSQDDPYDYPQMEWFRVPREEGRPMVGGPYFDYQGNERYSLTYAVPVQVGGRFVGIAGCDVIVARLESSVLPVLRRIRARAALLNHERRVVTANAPSLLTGERVPLEQVQAGQRFPVSTEQGWSLVVLPWPQG